MLQLSNNFFLVLLVPPQSALHVTFEKQPPTESYSRWTEVISWMSEHTLHAASAGKRKDKPNNDWFGSPHWSTSQHLHSHWRRKILTKVNTFAFENHSEISRFRFNKQEMPYQKYFKWLFLVENTSLSPGVNILFGSWVKPAPCRIPCPVCDTSSIAPPNGLVTTPIRPFPTPVMTPLAASLTSLARRIPWMGWSTIPATAPRRLRPKPPKPWDKPARTA